jgi:hypothetical protein
MPIDKRVASAAEALADVADGATVFISGFGGAGFPNVLIRALRDRGPKNLTLVVNSATHRYSYTHELIEAGLVRKVVCTAARATARSHRPSSGSGWREDRARMRAARYLLPSASAPAAPAFRRSTRRSASVPTAEGKGSSQL